MANASELSGNNSLEKRRDGAKKEDLARRADLEECIVFFVLIRGQLE